MKRLIYFGLAILAFGCSQSLSPGDSPASTERQIVPNTKLSVILKKAPGTAEWSYYTLTKDELVKVNSDAKAAGLRLVNLNIADLGVGYRYNAVWRPSNSNTFLEFGISVHDIQARHTEQTANGWKIGQMVARTEYMGSIYLDVEWIKNSIGEVLIGPVTQAQLEQEIANRVNDRLWTMTNLTVAQGRSNDPVYFFATYRPVGFQTGVSLSQTKSQFVDSWEGAGVLSIGSYDLNYRVVKQIAYKNSAGAIRYATLWRYFGASPPDGSFQLGVLASSTDFNNLYQQGWRVETLNAY